MAVKIPKELARIRVEDLGLSVRSNNALRSHHIETFGQLAQTPENELMGIYAFGKKCLEEVRDAIAKVLSSPGLTDVLLNETEGVEPEVERTEIRSPGRWRIPPYRDEMLDASVDLLDLSVRPTNVLNHLGISTVRQLLNYSRDEFYRTENIGRKSIAEIEAKLLTYLAGTSSTNPEEAGATDHTGMPSDAANLREFVNQMLAFLPDRQRNVQEDRYGLWDGIAETLQDVGDKLGLTRERIRQIEAKGWKRIHRRYSYGAVKRYICSKICLELETKSESWGVIGEDEAIAALGAGCTVGEVELAIDFLQDIVCPRTSLLASSLIEVESGVYCVDESTSQKYQKMLRLAELTLRSSDKPITEGHLIKDVQSQADDGDLSSDQLGLAHRVLAISPKVSRLRNGTFALSEWIEYRGRDKTSLAEAALRLLGRPAHFREITERVNALLQDQEGYSAGYILNTLIAEHDKFVRVKGGTYGLVKWGLKKPPYVKDRIIELLSTAGYPLPLWHLEEKVLEVCNCKPASIPMTLNLNPKLFKRFEGDQYGLREKSAK